MTFRTWPGTYIPCTFAIIYNQIEIYFSLLDFTSDYRLLDLWLNDNQIESLEGIADAIAGSRQKLTTIYLENNPCVWTLHFQKPKLLRSLLH